LRNLQSGDELLGIEIHTCWALIGPLQDSLSCSGGTKKPKLIAEGVSQECEVCSKLKSESQGLIEVLLDLLLRCEVKWAIGTRHL